MGRVISVSEVYELRTEIHDILENAMSKQAGNIAHILADVFNSASRQCHEILALQFPFITVSMTWFLLVRLSNSSISLS